jgi:ABC-type transport system involved in cytochrome c biogenesis permease subunit
LAELLFWPALLAYSEAAVAYLNDVRHPGVAGRLATWGVRVGWLVQTALLAVQATRANGFPWSTWGGSLNLIVWFVVVAYLIWGCQPRYRLLGLAVLPLAVLLFILARVGGGTGVGSRSHYSNIFLVLHVGLVLAAFAGFTLAAALSRLDEVAARTIAFALPALTLGIAVGIARLRERGGGFDVLMAVTIVTWTVYAASLALRHLAGWRGRRAAYLVLAGFVLVAVVRLALPVTHFAT